MQRWGYNWNGHQQWTVTVTYVDRLDFLRFGICRCAFVDIACPRWRVRLPCSLTLTLSLSRYVPRSLATIACSWAKDLKGSGKPKPSKADGL
jgi:hypothetical protein